MRSEASSQRRRDSVLCCNTHEIWTSRSEEFLLCKNSAMQPHVPSFQDKIQSTCKTNQHQTWARVEPSSTPSDPRSLASAECRFPSSTQLWLVPTSTPNRTKQYKQRALGSDLHQRSIARDQSKFIRQHAKTNHNLAYVRMWVSSMHACTD